MRVEKCKTCGGEANVGTAAELKGTKSRCAVVLRASFEDAEGKPRPETIMVSRCATKPQAALETQATNASS